MMKRIMGILILSLVVLASCNKESDGNNNAGLLLLGLLSASGGSSANDCKNNSGLVICIPPGVRF